MNKAIIKKENGRNMVYLPNFKLDEEIGFTENGKVYIGIVKRVQFEVGELIVWVIEGKRKKPFNVDNNTIKKKDNGPLLIHIGEIDPAIRTIHNEKRIVKQFGYTKDGSIDDQLDLCDHELDYLSYQCEKCEHWHHSTNNKYSKY